MDGHEPHNSLNLTAKWSGQGLSLHRGEYGTDVWVHSDVVEVSINDLAGNLDLGGGPLEEAAKETSSAR
ncbi:hypothetical protein CRG98_047684 [Punica granatum]|uniref:Uncharacterized protein n=1 Tax=Punica granatum TaxID=22663 RepID=A0A2I0HJS5_PUNGR|nr:hypothetical protein CRG98_047684 [Punica granatum]